jgi:DNA-binding transcriptional MerR regulator
LVNNIRKEFKPYMTVCRDSTGMILSEPSEIMEQWRQYFQNLLTDLDTTSTEISQELGEGSENESEEIEEKWKENEALKIDDIKKAIDRLKSNRSPGPGNIIAELLTIKQEIIEVTLQRIVCQIWKDKLSLNSGRRDKFAPSIEKEINYS